MYNMHCTLFTGMKDELCSLNLVLKDVRSSYNVLSKDWTRLHLMDHTEVEHMEPNQSKRERTAWLKVADVIFFFTFYHM